MRRWNACIAAGGSILLIAICVQLCGCARTRAVRESAPAAPAGAADAAKPADIAGTYTLVSINGQPLPFTVTHEPPGVRVLSGTFTFNADGTCSTTSVFVLPTGQEMNRQVGATWSREGARLKMKWEGAGVTTGTVEGDTFFMDNEGQRFAYRRTR